MNLTEFLLARIAEDEAVAREAVAEARPDWVVGCVETSDGENVFWSVEALGEPAEFFMDLGDKPSDHARALHVAHNDPSRVLAECAAKRRIVEDHANVTGLHVPRGRIDHCDRCMILRYLALPYADHPDYDEEWKV